MAEASTYIRRPRTASPQPFTPLQVAQAYNYPAATGAGLLGGIIELGGGFGQSDLQAWFGGLGVPVPKVVSKLVAGGRNKSDGPDGADGEVLLDIEVAGAVAPGATFNVYFAPNTDSGFAAAIEQAVKDGCDAISISWGGPESSWSASAVKAMEAAFAAAKDAGCQVFAASGDSGSSDGARGRNVDYPASSPSVCGCGGTRLTVNADGQRAAEVVWDDNDTTSAGGGGVSVLFPGRDVPDVAGNADPDSGYEVLVDGESFVIGGTSAVAPLMLGLYLRLKELHGASFDLVATVAANATVCFDVTSGDNGAYRAGPGRDEATGFGVVDGTRLLAALGGGTAPPPGDTDPADMALWAEAGPWAAQFRDRPDLVALKAAIEAWGQAKGLVVEWRSS